MKAFHHIALAALALLACIARAEKAPEQSAAAQEKAPIGFSAHVELGNDFRFRGISQTGFKPTVNSGLEYIDASGFYLGNWDSNVCWISTGQSGSSYPIEMDFYGGYTKDWEDIGLGVDLGTVLYYYPGRGPTSTPKKPSTHEIFFALAYRFVSLKVFYTTANLFGSPNSAGSTYLVLATEYDTGFEGITLVGHVGRQTVRSAGVANYADWEIGLTKEFSGKLTAKLSYVGTNAKTVAYQNPVDGRNLGHAAVQVSLTQAF
ncbi:MAG: TorF family putative porin [Candidatus Protistobacter heckmanni]|nr:TorF family putative porin [Candidatus Protistobacter heckmanni]